MTKSGDFTEKWSEARAETLLKSKMLKNAILSNSGSKGYLEDVWQNGSLHDVCCKR